MHSNQLRHSLLSIFSWLFFFFNLFNSTPFFRKSIEKLCAMSYVFILQPSGFRAVFPQSSGARRKPKLEPLEAAG